MIKSLEKFGYPFANKILNNLPQGTNENNLTVYDSGLVTVKNPKNNKGQIVLGCPICFKTERGTNEQGYPTIAGKSAIAASEYYDLPNNITEGMKAKMWICPGCKVLLPGFSPKTTKVI